MYETFVAIKVDSEEDASKDLCDDDTVLDAT